MRYKAESKGSSRARTLFFVQLKLLITKRRERLYFLLFNSLQDLVNIYISIVLHGLRSSRTFFYFVRIQISLLIKDEKIIFHYINGNENKLGQLMCKSSSQKWVLYKTQPETCGGNSKINVSSMKEKYKSISSMQKMIW